MLSLRFYYIGLNKTLENINHHTLFFDEDITQHAVEIYKKPMWPNKPLFYVCCPSKTDNNVAPTGHENLFLLMPVATDLEDTEEIREKYFQIMIARMEQQFNVEILSHIDYKQGYCVKDFISDYNSYKGNAYGLANTLMQTAVLKPKELVLNEEQQKSTGVTSDLVRISIGLEDPNDLINDLKDALNSI